MFSLQMKRKLFVQQNFFAENDAKGNDPFASGAFASVFPVLEL